MPINQSVCIPILPPMERSELLREIAAIGYPAIEIWGRDEQFSALCAEAAEHGLKIVSMIGHDSLPDGLNNRENHSRIEAELRASIDIAVASDVAGLICFSGNCIEGMGEEEAIENTVDGFLRIASYAEDQGINLNLELLNSKIDHAGYQCDSTAWGLEVVESRTRHRRSGRHRRVLGTACRFGRSKEGDDGDVGSDRREPWQAKESKM